MTKTISIKTKCKKKDNGFRECKAQFVNLFNKTNEFKPMANLHIKLYDSQRHNQYLETDVLEAGAYCYKDVYGDRLLISRTDGVMLVFDIYKDSIAKCVGKSDEDYREYIVTLNNGLEYIINFWEI